MPVTEHTELLNIFRNFIFPLSKQDLIQQAKKHGVRHEIINRLECLPDREFTSLEDFLKEYDSKYHD